MTVEPSVTGAPQSMSTACLGAAGMPTGEDPAPMAAAQEAPRGVDQRAAGVISGDDPYRELELYLEKVQNEIGEVFEQWKTNGLSDSVDVIKSEADADEENSNNKIGDGASSGEVIKQRENSNEIQSTNYKHLHQRRKERQRTMAADQAERADQEERNDSSYAADDDEVWPDNIVAEMNSIILEQLRVLESNEELNQVPPSTFTKTLEIREPRDQYTQTTPNSLSPTASSVTWASEYSLYDTCRDGLDEDNKSSTTCSSYNDEPRSNSKEELSCECLSSGDSLDGIGTVCSRRRCWLGLRRRSFSAPTGAECSLWTGTGDAMTQTSYEPPSSAENLMMDSRSEEVDSGIGILSDGDKNNGHGNGAMVDDDSVCDKQSLQLALDFGAKSCSDPVLKRRDESMEQSAQIKAHSQSDQKLTEIEVAEAIRWLRIAGFPQYAQMFEELSYPVDLTRVKQDHPFLQQDALQALFRRLILLNRWTLVKLNVHHVQRRRLSRDSDNAVSPAREPHLALRRSTGSIEEPNDDQEQESSPETGAGGVTPPSPATRRAFLDKFDDDYDDYALSLVWTFQQYARRWSRIGEPQPSTSGTAMVVHHPAVGMQTPNRVPATAAEAEDAVGEIRPEGGANGVYMTDEEGLPVINFRDVSMYLDPPDPDLESPNTAVQRRRTPEEAEDCVGGDDADVKMTNGTAAEGASGGNMPPGGFHRSNSERIRDGAKAFLRQVESFKTRHRKRQHREGVVISGPQLLDLETAQKMSHLNFSDLSTSPKSEPTFLLVGPGYNYGSDGSQSSSTSTMSNEFKPQKKSLVSGSVRRRYLQPSDASDLAKVLNNVNPFDMRKEDATVHSDSDCYGHFTGTLTSDIKKAVTLDRKTTKGSKGRRLMRTGSLTVKSKHEQKPQRPRRDSDSNLIPSHITRKVREDFIPKTLASLSLSHDHPRMRWHSFQQAHSSSLATDRQSQQRREKVAIRNMVHCFQPVATTSRRDVSLVPISALSCGQIQLMRKFALVSLTGLMEKYCPTHRSGWNWELPKFIRKTKVPTYADKKAFGVPLTVTMQRTGQALPICIQKAILWLQANALDQVGLFRKPGVKSRIQALKQLMETYGDDIDFDKQQAFDVADTVKQYFRELPEAVFTNKLSETFISIFQYLPEYKRAEAVESAILLLPDEHREALQVLLEFLNLVSEHVYHNQMSERNIAVCLAPSLFYFAHNHGNTISSNNSNGTPIKPAVSPIRKKATGIPDNKELFFTKASHECLQYLISKSKILFKLRQAELDKCNFTYMDESIPLNREELGSDTNQSWLAYQYECTSALLKEARKESRGWTSVHTFDPLVDVACKKVGDGHPLRLWRVTTEVEAPPLEVLNSILHERSVWDSSLIRCFVAERPEAHCDVFCYTTASMAPLPPREYCVVRSWSTDLSKGACSMVETSVKRPMTYTTPPGTPKSFPYLGTITGVVLASRYFIEPCGSGRSKVMHLSRVDTKGRSLEFYTKIYGHISASHLTNLRKSFVIKSEGPESKV